MSEIWKRPFARGVPCGPRLVWVTGERPVYRAGLYVAPWQTVNARFPQEVPRVLGKFPFHCYKLVFSFDVFKAYGLRVTANNETHFCCAHCAAYYNTKIRTPDAD